MLARRFGKTELSMPVLTCGGMRYQHQWQDVPWSAIPPEGQANLEATVRQAVALGITHIETARGYGSSEMQLGRVLPTLNREQIIVQTKVGPAPAREFRQTLETSLRYLQLDYVDLLSIHGINTLAHVQMQDCIAMAEQLVQENKARHLGFSTHGPLEVILAAIETGRFSYVNLHWYYINQTNWPAIKAARDRDMGVFIISPADKGGKLYNPPPKLVELCQPLSPMQFNDLFCLAHPEVHTLSIGAARPSDFAAHVEAVALLDQADTLLPPIVARLEQALIDSLGETWAKTWHVGLPKPEDTPGHINIPTILWLRNLVLAYDMLEYGKARYNLLGSGGHWFPGNRAEHINARALQDCLRHSPHRDQIPAYLEEAHRLLSGAAVQRLSRS